MLQKTPLLLGGSNTKSAIVSVLSQGAPLSTQQVYHQVTKETSKPISYQALHKALKELEVQSVIEKANNQYQLNPTGVHSIENWAQETKNKIMQQTEEQQKPEIHSFSNVVELGRFIIFELFNHPNPDQQPIISRWHIMYSLIGLSKEEMDEVRKHTKNKQHRIVCKGNSLIDKTLAVAYRKLGDVKVKLGMNIPESFDTRIVGNHVCEIYFDPGFLSLFRRLWATPKKSNELDLQAVLEGMHTHYPCKAIMYHDPARAQQIREKVLKEFNQ